MNKPKQLYRSSRNRILAGVCGGLAEYFNIDLVIVRLAFVALTALNGIGLSIYIILAIITPSDNKPGNQPKDNLNDLVNDFRQTAGNLKQQAKQERQAKLWLGVGLSVLGLLLLADNLAHTNLNQILQRLFWPAVIIAIGVYLINKKS